MSESNHEEDIRIQNERSLAKLVRAINLSLGKFSLIVVRCNYGVIKPHISEKLQQESGLQIQEVSLDGSATNLYEVLHKEIGSSSPDVVIVSGFESVGLLDDLLISMNQGRDNFSRAFPFPLVLWINDWVLQKFVRLAPDYYSYAGVPIQFAIATDELIEFLQEQIEGVFNRILADDTDVFISTTTTDIGKRWEIESALKELANRGCHQLELEASEKFILGRDAYINNDMVRARQLWSENLTFWQTQENSENLNNSSLLTPNSSLLNLNSSLLTLNSSLYTACVLFHLGLWWRRYAVQHRGEYQAACTKARDYYQQCVDILRQINRLDLVAKFIGSLGETLFQLQQWDELEQVAKQAIELHRTYRNNTRLAHAYGFLAEVALGRKNWLKAKKYGEIALEIFDLGVENPGIEGEETQGEETPGVEGGETEGGETPPLRGENFFRENGSDINAIANRQVLLTSKLYKSWYLFLISQAQQNLNQVLLTLQNLKMAQEEAIPDFHPQLYRTHLRSIAPSTSLSLSWFNPSYYNWLR